LFMGRAPKSIPSPRAHHWATLLSQQSENSILVLTCLESDQETNKIVIEDSFFFPTVIYTTRYDKRFRSYVFSNISQAAVSLCWQTETIWDNCIFDHRAIIISENL
jgi:hypothetical protein